MFDINQAISRSFTISLRYLHLCLQLLLSQLISKLSNQQCSQTLIKIGLPICYIMLALNIIAIFLLKIKQWFHRNFYFVIFAIDLVLAGVVLIVGFGGIGEDNSCANNRVLHRFVGFQCLAGIVLSGIGLFGEFYWGLRYANAPGNLVWPFLFFGFDWTNSFKGSYITVGVFTLLISLAVFLTNIVTLKLGLTNTIRKIIQVCWIICLVVMVLCEIIVFSSYLAGANATEFNDQIAKKLGQTFLAINILDGLFWLWGYLTLKYTNGDIVRDTIMKQDPKFDDNDLDHHGKNGFGTIKKN